MNRTRRILSTLGLAALLGTTLPSCVIAARGHVATGAVVAYDQPPPPREEAYQQQAGYVWVHGNWTWQGGQWVWIDGHVERERSGYAWQDGKWEPRNGSWHWVEGSWVVVGGGAVVTGGGGGQVYDPHNQDHRYDGQGNGQGGVIITNDGPVNGNGQGGVIVGNGGIVGNNGQGGLVATNGAGTVIVGQGGVVITGPTAPPPPPRVENAGPARRGYIWIDGSYNWNDQGKQYEWVPGHWERMKAKHRWDPPRWQLQGNVYVRVGGSWVIN